MLLRVCVCVCKLRVHRVYSTSPTSVAEPFRVWASSFWGTRHVAMALWGLGEQDSPVEDRVGDNIIVAVTICIQPENILKNVTLYIDDVRYSNDGPSDLVMLSMNGVRYCKHNLHVSLNFIDMFSFLSNLLILIWFDFGLTLFYITTYINLHMFFHIHFWSFILWYIQY